MALSDTVDRALQTVAKLKKSRSGNEANTKALLIEPILGALGWDTADLDDVEREVRVFDGTFLDYALKIEGRACLYVEAKGIGEKLGDDKFVAQAINYANNDGVVWCVLTNGLRWRVYKTNESAPMDKKMLFELDLGDDSEDQAAKLKMLKLIDRATVAAGELDRFGDRLFTDARVRKALADVAGAPPQALVDALNHQMGHPPVSLDALKLSLGRIFDAPAPAPSIAASDRDGGRPAPDAGPPTPPKRDEYDLEHHLGNKSVLIRDLFEAVNSYGLALGPDVTRRVRKQYVGYFRGKRSFFTAELQQRRMLVYLSLDPSEVRPWDEATMRDARHFGHFGMGDTELSLTGAEQLPPLERLIRQAYDRRG